MAGNQSIFTLSARQAYSLYGIFRAYMCTGFNWDLRTVCLVVQLLATSQLSR